MRPRLLRCPACGGDHYAFSPIVPCQRCRVEARAHQEELAAEARRQREGRRQERLDGLSEPPAGPAYGEFPEGY